jgi:hypothetical protein
MSDMLRMASLSKSVLYEPDMNLNLRKDSAGQEDREDAMKYPAARQPLTV